MQGNSAKSRMRREAHVRFREGLGAKFPGPTRQELGKQRLRVAKLQAKAARQRLDRLHKISREIVSGHDAVFAEDLNISGMMKNHHLARSVQDTSWGELQRQLKYKCKREGKVFATVDRFFPSSQLCSACGEKNPIVKDLSIREWTCPHCGAHHDRDINAAMNICTEGMRKALSR
ncbi:MAG: IS200/IS605 family element transposase accessory protein TnpB [Clostridia bacterium]|nr:IS200/IS605 family element transposase accessory protein TnpB [Clostridia bacterium]